MAFEFDEVEIDRYYSWNAKAFPTFSTNINDNPYGIEQPNINRYDVIWKFNISLEGLEEDTRYADFINLYMTRWGRAIGFRFLNFADYKWANNEQIGTYATGVSTYSLYRTYIKGSRSYIRRIVKPNNDLVISVNGVTAPATVNTATGKITLSGSHTNGHVIRVVSGTYCTPVRFDEDQVEFTGFPSTFDLTSARLTELLPISLGID